MNPEIVLIGDVFLDVTLTPLGDENKMRLGGLIHPARALWALGVSFELAYIAPGYLDKQIENYAKSLGPASINKIGDVTGAPNVALIGEPTEAGNQNYELLMRDAYECQIDMDKLKGILGNKNITDIVIFPGNYNLEPVLVECSQSTAKIHIDMAYGIPDLEILGRLGKKFDTGIISTSSGLFLDRYEGSLENLRDELLIKYCKTFLFKENRGGGRFFDKASSDAAVNVEAQVRHIVHSIGVGDCYNVIFVALKHKYDNRVALTYASWAAAEYAATTYPDDFKSRCEKLLKISADEIVKLKGVSVPWEKRPSFQIYIAAPDFDFVDQSDINKLIDSLRYHNFTPRAPVREFGQMPENATREKKQYFYDSDVHLLYGCQMLIAVLLYDDPGTLVEIGLALGAGIPVAIYDPYKKASNPMLTQSANLISSNLDEIIGQVFMVASRLKE
jgi:nucleoside 2-deoxyribosyltransferase